MKTLKWIISQHSLLLRFAGLLLLFPVCTAFGQRPDPKQIIVNEDTLKGIKAMSVMVSVDGIRDIPESTYRSDIESRLKAAGITVLQPTDNPKTYPCLWLIVDGDFIHTEDGRLAGSIVTYRLMFYQLFPQKVGSQTVYTRGATYELHTYLWGDSMSIAFTLRRAYTASIDEFVQDYKKANSSR